MAKSSAMRPSDLLREVGEARGPLGGKTAGAGCSQAAVSMPLAAAIFFFSRTRRCGQANAAMLLRRHLVEGMSLAESSRLAQVTPRAGQRMLAAFRETAGDFCRREGVAYEAFCRA